MSSKLFIFVGGIPNTIISYRELDPILDTSDSLRQFFFFFLKQTNVCSVCKDISHC